jgi:hypothetical protein
MDGVFQLMRMQHHIIADLQLITLIRMVNYGLCLANGQGVSAGVIEEEKCFILSANRKHSSARFFPGLCCYLESDVASTEPRGRNHSKRREMNGMPLDGSIMEFDSLDFHERAAT